MRAPVLSLAFRFGCLVGCLGGCLQTTATGSDCHIDSDCSGRDVCARDELCTAPGDVRAVVASWTVKGMAASVASCGAHPDLYIQFSGSSPGDTLGFAPVPCRNGQFTVDKLPRRFIEVELGIEGGFHDIKPITAANTSTLNVEF